MQEISLLLGAGFSVNQGYPTASQINKKLLELEHDDFYVHTSGIVILKEKNAKDPCWYSDYARDKIFVIQLIKFFSKRNEFNYEEFYDFYNSIYRGEIKNEEFNELCNTFRKSYHSQTNDINLLSHTNNIFNQLISHFLVDANGKKFYDPIHYCKPMYPGYTGFLYCLEKWGDDGITHIHTLNHDIFFEIFRHSDWIQGKLSDGFEELGSSYYGKLYDRYKVRLPFFTDKYIEKFRLYKLHGSIDQFPFHIHSKGIDAYIKIKLGVGTTELYKEIQDENGSLTYINDWINYHPDFLSGTTSKILRYREPFYYEKVFNHFEINLLNSNKLIAIGYGCGDTEINNLIEKNFDFKNKRLFVVDPYPTEKTIYFLDKFQGTLITKTPDNISFDDFE
jgi:hypothetical protein